jgi:hypothetical protein
VSRRCQVKTKLNGGIVMKFKALILLLFFFACSVKETDKSSRTLEPEISATPSWVELNVKGSNLDFNVVDEFLKEKGLPNKFEISLVTSESEGKERIEKLEKILHSDDIQKDVVKFFLYNVLTDIYLRLSLYNPKPEYFAQAEKYARYVIDKYGDDERFRAYTSVTRDNLAYIYSLTGRFDEALRVWEDLIDKYSDIVESPDYGNWFGVQCLFSIFGALDRVCGDNFRDDRYIKAVSFLERISSLRNDEVGLFADMLLYEYYFKSGKKDFADKKFKLVETRIANYSSPSIHNFWQGMQAKVKRWESWKKAKGG